MTQAILDYSCNFLTMWEYLEDRDKYRLQPREWGDVRAKSLEGLYAAQISTCPYCAIVMKTITARKTIGMQITTAAKKTSLFIIALNAAIGALNKNGITNAPTATMEKTMNAFVTIGLR